MLKRIRLFKNLGIYREFRGTDPFKKFNAIYGFNGSGKSTLCRALAALSGEKIEYSETGSSVIFECYDGTDWEVRSSAKHCEILCYDEDFLVKNFRWEQGIRSFVVIGKRSDEDERRSRTLHEQKESLVTEKKLTDEQIRRLKDLTGNIATDSASALRSELLQFNPTKYNRYDRRPFLIEVDKIRSRTRLAKGLNDVPELRININRPKLENIPEVSSPPRLFTELMISVREFLLRPFPTKPEREHSPAELQWLESGLILHEEKDECLFCQGKLSPDRRIEIRSDLTNEVARYIKEGIELLARLDSTASSHQLPAEKEFYLEDKQAVAETLSLIGDHQRTLGNLLLHLRACLSDRISFVERDCSELMSELTAVLDTTQTFYSQLNSIIRRQNLVSLNIERERIRCIEEIETIHFQEYARKAGDANDELGQLQDRREALEKEIHLLTLEANSLDSLLQSEARAIIGINNMITGFLGRADLALEYRESEKKFEVVRRDLPAKRLSEGEKTAIALCYFLILANANPDLRKDLIVVLDDPISSLDSNNLYNAYAVLKQNLMEVKQIFVLTHNLSFFRITGEWFKSVGASDSAYFKIEVATHGSNLNSALVQMTKQSRESSSEYELLYCHLKSFIRRCDREHLTDTDFLPYPNMLRRLLEAYLFSRKPGAKSDIEAELLELGVDRDIARVAARFCHDFSHAKFDSIYGVESRALSQAPAVVKQLLEELERVDPKHFNSMARASGD